ncbi:TonB-dependent receptor [Dysgonomonas sp. Marseille-P4361]|uniref:SusC/RagA family TonB-linked outer membrane protein n=1 Tax=Dysgonomonas sp. Marseille-P4361 TaxID=2161820 RepID=UPI000D54C6E5|nr:TonB-dependent receptor [Dysgonomonas sp. Marseille-P4361]
MHKIYYCLLILFLAVSSSLSAQESTYTIEGKIYDEMGPLIGVTVSIKSKIGTAMSDIDGKFSIKASRGDWLVFSYVGYETQEWLVTENKKDLDIKLAVKTQEMEEIVITGTGAQRKISTVAAISTVSPSELQTPSPSIANMLGGKVAGIISMVSSGEPGQNLAEFWVRGRGTFGANDGALVLVDGLPGDINTIDPADIESFSVLKDASATAVYGVRGANGVIIVTTKRGQSGKLRITGRANVSVSHLRRLPEYLRAHDYAMLTNEAYQARNEDPAYSPIEMQVIKDGLDTDLYPDVDWQGEIVKNVSFKQKYYVSAQGGGDVARYFVSLDASNESAAYKTEKNNPYATNAGFNDYSFRLNLDINLTKSTVLYFGSNAYLSMNKRPGMMNTDGIWIAQAAYTPLLFPLQYSNGQLPAATTTSGSSPYVMINHSGKTDINRNTEQFTMRLEQDLSMLTKGLSVHVQGAYDREGELTERRYYQPAQYRAIGRNSKGELLTREIVAKGTDAFYSSYEKQYRKFYFESKALYNRIFDEKHRVGGLLRFEIENKQWSDQTALNLNRSLAMIPEKYIGLSGQVEYSYNDTYLTALNFGYNGTENFIPGKQFGFFPSVSIGWIPTGYEWVKENLPWLDIFKIRASYGVVGNDKLVRDPDGKLRRFPYLDRINSGYVYPWGSGRLESIGISLVGANNLIWEKEKKTNLGFDFQFLKNALTLTVDFFKDKREGIFQERVQVPDYVGLTNNPFGNVGEMSKWGSDGTISYTHDINKDMSFTIRGNYTFTRNKIENWEQTYNKYPYQDLTGVPLNTVRGYQCIGFFKDEDDIKYSPKQSWGTVLPGDLKYKDMNGDGKIDVDDQVPIAHERLPQIMYGFGGEFRYKNVSLGFLFKGTGKTDYFRNSVGYVPFADGELGNVLTRFNDPSTRWIPRSYAEANGIDLSLAENPNATLPRLQYGWNENNMQTSDFWKGDAKYLRLQEVVINYNLKNEYLKKVGISSMDLQLVGNNLIIWDKVKDFDPEQAHHTGKKYPIPSVYSFQLYLHF